MTSEEFAAIAKKDPVVILPVGALEEHGRHLPLGADVIQPLHVVDEVARRTNAYVAPAIPYGVCTTTRPYPGTVSVSVDALKGFVRDVLADFVRNGVRRVMILSGHAGREHMMALRARKSSTRGPDFERPSSPTTTSSTHRKASFRRATATRARGRRRGS